MMRIAKAIARDLILIGGSSFVLFLPLFYWMSSLLDGLDSAPPPTHLDVMFFVVTYSLALFLVMSPLTWFVRLKRIAAHYGIYCVYGILLCSIYNAVQFMDSNTYAPEREFSSFLFGSSLMLISLYMYGVYYVHQKLNLLKSLEPKW